MKLLAQYKKWIILFSLIGLGCASMMGSRQPASLSKAEIKEIEDHIDKFKVNLNNIKAVPDYYYDRKLKSFKEALLVKGRFLFNGKFGINNFNDEGKLLLKMSRHRDYLLEHNLYNAGIQPNSNTDCTSVLYKYDFPRRTPEGTCYFSDDRRGRNPNHFNDEDEQFKNKEFIGSKGSRLGRNIIMSAQEIRKVNENILSPNPREVSTELFKRKNGMIPAKVINVLSAAWLQGQNHDWFSHGRNKTPDAIKEIKHAEARSFNPAEFNFFNVPAVRGDKEFPNGLKIPRTAPDLTKFDRTSFDTTFTNNVTHWWDASHIYGSDAETITNVRTNPISRKIYPKGLIAVDEKNRRLYYDEEGLPITGFTDNWWVGLELIHTIFALEHNRIAKSLWEKYGKAWTDKYGSDEAGDIAFEKSRLVNSALIAKIHTTEWTPALLFNKALHVGMNGNWYGFRDLWGLNSKFLRKWAKNSKIPGSHAISGVVGPGTLSLYGVPFTLTEEFVSIYRMHPLIPDKFHRVNNEGRNISSVLMNDTRNELSGKMLRRGRTITRNAMFSAGVNSAGALTLNNYPDFMLNMKVPRNTDGRPGLEIDLAAADILRDRERLTPRYNDFRRKFFLKPISKFSDLFNDKNNPHIKVLDRVYGGDVEKMDLLVGTLAEETKELRYPGFAFGNTPFYMFALMASRRLMGDPFFSDYYTDEVYTKLGMCWVEEATMKSVILRHFPEFTGAMIGITNAFRPWKRTGLSNLSHKNTAGEVCPKKMVKKEIHPSDER